MANHYLFYAFQWLGAEELLTVPTRYWKASSFTFQIRNDSISTILGAFILGLWRAGHEQIAVPQFDHLVVYV